MKKNMMKQKRKYTRKVSPDNSQVLSNRVKSSISGNLPPDILKAIELTVSNRKALGLYDDSKERIERAIRYQEFRRGKNG